MEAIWRLRNAGHKETGSLIHPPPPALRPVLISGYNPPTVNETRKTWYVYLLECADGTLYTGITTDPQRRLKQHNAGRAARYTRTRRPVRLLGSRATEGRVAALKLEKRIKRWRPPRKRAFFEH